MVVSQAEKQGTEVKVNLHCERIGWNEPAWDYKEMAP